MKRHLSGFGLLDILLTLAVSAVIIVMSISYYGNIRDQQKINQTIEQLQQIKQVEVNIVNEGTAVTTAQSSKTLSSKIFNNNNIASLSAFSSLFPATTLKSAWDRSSLTIKGPYAASQCLATAVTICGITDKVSSRLKNKFTNTFTGGQYSISNQCATFTMCLQ